MINLQFITNGNLPVPASEGGAVEYLLTQFIEYNERHGEFLIKVYTPAELKKTNYSYEYTSIITVNSNSPYYKLEKGIRYVMKRVHFPVNSVFINRIISTHHEDLCKADLIVVENNPEHLKVLRKYSPVPVWFHSHNDYFNVHDPVFSAKLLDDADRVIAVSKFIKQSIKSASSNQKRRINVIYNGVEVQRFGSMISNSSVSKLRFKHQILPKDFVVLYIGRIERSKGVMKAIEACDRLNSKIQCKLVLVGEDRITNLTKRESEAVDRLKRSNSIVYTGFVSHKEIPQYYKIASVAINLTLVEEAFGLSLVEAMAAGVATVTSDSGAHPEIANRDTSIFVSRDSNMVDEVFEAIYLLYSNKQLRDQLGASGKLRARQFSIKAYCKKLSTFIKAKIAA